MIDLSVKYLGLTLKNPIIVGSSDLSNSLGEIKKLESNGAVCKRLQADLLAGCALCPAETFLVCPSDVLRYYPDF